MDNTIETPLLDGHDRHHSVVLPALQKLLQLAHSQDTDKQIEAVIGISKLVERRSVDLSSFGPLCHVLTRLVASEHRPVVAYAARSIKVLVLDDKLRPQATRVGIPSILAAALIRWRGDMECLREVLGAMQTLCYDESTVLHAIDAGVLEPVLELLDADDGDVRHVSIATLTNILSFSDTLLLSREECINAVRDRMDIVVGDIQRPGPTTIIALAALANSCAHPVLAGRAKELGAPEALPKLVSMRWLRVGTNNRWPRRPWLARTAMARLNGYRPRRRDVEEGGSGGDEGAGYDLQFFRFKWGSRRSQEMWVPASDVTLELLNFVMGRPPRCMMARRLHLLCLRWRNLLVVVAYLLGISVFVGVLSGFMLR